MSDFVSEMSDRMSDDMSDFVCFFKTDNLLELAFYIYILAFIVS